MATLHHLFARVWLVLLALTCAFASSCTCAPVGQAPAQRGILACKSPQFVTTLGISSPTKIVPGASATSFNGTPSGDAALSIPLDMPPGRAGFAPELAISYSSSATESALGMGFALSGASSIGRCRKEMVLDGEISNVQFNEDDALCLDGKRLIAITNQGDQIEYRTFPDSQTKIIGNFADPANSSFEVFLPNGHRILFGSTDAGRVMSNEQVPSQWLAEESRDARGNVIHYDWCLANDESGYTAEYALTSIRYGDAIVVFDYDIREDVQTTYWRGMQMQESLQLATIEMQVDNTLVRRYEFAYEQSETTKRTLLQSVQACAGTECFAPTRFHYGKSETGFERIATNIANPLSDKSSPMFFDIDGDGLSDYVVGDSTPASTAEHPMTEWRIAKNLGGTFAPEKVALLQD
ncbi:MAG TPA: SpvB/TcaC N-terminal domain-containing protein, partial [Polyangium sp.]|nr:SpvB/TcaC N-terminal domain-containing protein [Polyangium sp.]